MKDIKILFGGLLLFLCVDSYAQKETTWWYFFQTAGLDFTNITPVSDTNSNDSVFTNGLTTGVNVTSISDEQGVLQFYGSYVGTFNRNHQLMPNGLINLPASSEAEEGTIVVPRPNNPGQYYFFYGRTSEQVYADGLTSGIFYSLVDMELDNSLGDVVDTIKNVLVADSTDEKIACTPHANGIDFWIMIRQSGTNNYKAFLVTETGVSTTPVITSVGTISVNYGFMEGNLRFNHAGDLLANSIGLELEILDFDNNTGLLSNLRVITPFYLARGLEFSADDSRLYSGGPTQFDVSTPTQSAIQASEVYMGGAFPIMAGLQMGLDGFRWENLWEYIHKSQYVLLHGCNPRPERVGHTMQL